MPNPIESQAVIVISITPEKMCDMDVHGRGDAMELAEGIVDIIEEMLSDKIPIVKKKRNA